MANAARVTQNAPMFAQNSSNATRRIGFLLLPGFSNLCLANAVEPLRAANELSGWPCYRHRLVSLDGASVSSSSGIEVKVDGALDDALEGAFEGAGRLDAFFVISSYDYRDFATPALKAALHRMAGRSTWLGGLDTGPWLLASAALLDGRRATIHWQEQARLREDFPEVEVTGDRYVVDRGRITAGGATTVLDLMLSLLRRDVGEVLALDVMRLFVYDEERPAEGQQRGLLHAPFAARAPIVAAAIAAMEQRVETPAPLPEIAAAAGCSQRKLERAFDRALGVTPRRYYDYLRLSAARRMLLDDGRTVAQAAEATGFGSASSFARAYRRLFGQSPRQVKPSATGRASGTL